jgi:hypothetical protein
MYVHIYTIQDSDEIDDTAVQLTNKALAAASHDEQVTVFLFCVLGGHVKNQGSTRPQPGGGRWALRGGAISSERGR